MLFGGNECHWAWIKQPVSFHLQPEFKQLFTKTSGALFAIFPAADGVTSRSPGLALTVGPALHLDPQSLFQLPIPRVGSADVDLSWKFQGQHRDI